ncbi:MAG: TonB family protein [Desulfobacteraceae bacterium]|jgi:TonB family protein
MIRLLIFLLAAILIGCVSQKMDRENLTDSSSNFGKLSVNESGLNNAAILIVSVLRDGRIENVELLKSSGSPKFDEAVIVMLYKKSPLQALQNDQFVGRDKIKLKVKVARDQAGDFQSP